MSAEISSTTNATNHIMNPDRVAFNLRPEVRDKLRIYMAKKGYNLREQSNAINDLLEFALDQKDIKGQKL